MPKNGPFWRVFENLKLAVKQCYQTSQLKKDKNWWKMPKFNTDILSENSQIKNHLWKYYTNLAIKIGLCAAHVPSSSLNKISLNTPSDKHKSSKPKTNFFRSTESSVDFCVKMANKSGMSRNSAACKKRGESQTFWLQLCQICILCECLV